ncbi:9233_t:CDS:10 [Ambispora gerdemannii]|uniref:9233_t:CDS:1 n=1 Tax=Ambispora gerdemannii TaxID=144530 RepID=A0A9N8YMS4_9GLOM|nr:9233_t:CDS:10 [Ambispora gerdemannii]
MANIPPPTQQPVFRPPPSPNFRPSPPPVGYRPSNSPGIPNQNWTPRPQSPPPGAIRPQTLGMRPPGGIPGAIPGAPPPVGGQPYLASNSALPGVRPSVSPHFRPGPLPPPSTGRPINVMQPQTGYGYTPNAQPPNYITTASPPLPEIPVSPANTNTSPQLSNTRPLPKRQYPKQQMAETYTDPTNVYDQTFTPATPGIGQEIYGQPPTAQSSMGTLTNQFSNMAMNGLSQSQSHTVHLIGFQPNVRDLDAPPPPIILPPNSSVTSSENANCDPSYKRCTLNTIPATSALLNKSRLPLALVITPYRSVKDGDEPVPVVTDTVIARCRRCRTYINPFVTFVENGHKWRCNMCFLLNEVPNQFDWDIQSNAPTDRWKRAELNHAVVEFVAPTEYMVRPPQPPVYLFVIDVSFPAVQSGIVATAARTILESLDRLPNEDNRTKIGFITVDTSLHFYSLSPNTTEPQMLVVSDLEDVFLPQPDDLLVNLSEARTVVESLLNRLGDMFKDTQIVGNALGSALSAGFKLVSSWGGKLIVVQSSLPSINPGGLKNREDTKALGTQKESTLLQSADPFYKKFAVDCSRSQVCVDMFLLGSQYSDVATLSCCPRYTGGQTYFYPAFNAGRSEDALKFAHEFAEFLASPIGLEAVMRVRASKGIRMTSFHGNFFVRQTDLLALPNVSRDHSYAIELAIEDNLTTPTVCFQTAVLHTTCYGERRIRVLTLALPVTNSLSEMFASADQVAITTLLANKAVERSLTSKLEDSREALTNKIIDILGVYKSALTPAHTGASPQLQISDNLKLLPLLSLGLLKHVGLRASSQIPTDLRAYAMCLLTTMPSQLLITYLHPRFYSLHDMPLEVGTHGPDGIIMPVPLNLTSEKLERHGIYLVEDGQNIFIWVGKDVSPQLFIDLFNVRTYEEIRGGKSTLPQLETSFSQRVNAIIGKTRESRRGVYYPHLYIVKQDGDPSLRLWFLSHIIEDRTDTVMSYIQWLGYLKDRVNAGAF